MILLGILALAAGLCFCPLRLAAAVAWREWTLRGEVRLLMGLVCLAAEVCLEPLTFRATLNGKPLAPSPKKGGKKRGGGVKLVKAFLRTLRCRRLSVSFDLGIAEDAAATALVYGSLQALTQSILAWGKAQGGRCDGAVQAHFDAPRYEGSVEGIFSTDVAHIISSLNQMRR